MSTATTQEIDILELIKAGTHFTERRGDKIHIVDSRTGETFILFAANSSKLPEKLELFVLEDGTKVWTQESLVPSTKNIREVQFNPLVIDLMCQELVESNRGITEICKMEGFPSYNTLCRWRREHPWIDEALEKARKDRAERYRDEVLVEARKAISSKDPINATNTKIEALKWAAGVDEPARFSPKAKIDATISTPTQIIVHTGIDRSRPVDQVTETPQLEEKSDDQGS